jgi:hypothetical protein
MIQHKEESTHAWGLCSMHGSNIRPWCYALACLGYVSVNQWSLKYSNIQHGGYLQTSQLNPTLVSYIYFYFDGDWWYKSLGLWLWNFKHLLTIKWTEEILKIFLCVHISNLLFSRNFKIISEKITFWDREWRELCVRSCSQNFVCCRFNLHQASLQIRTS